MTNLIILIGDLGAGKTTLACWFAEFVRANYPKVPIVSNVQMEAASVIQDTNKFLAIKLTKKDKRYALVIMDEAAQAGLESRGSGSKGAALESRIITLARKAHVDLILVSQLSSMIDKRAQWLINYSILCEAKFESDNPSLTPDYFEYTVYDSNQNEIDGFEISTQDAREYLWPRMDTDDIPFKSSLDKQFKSYFDIEDQDMLDYEKLMVVAK